MRRVLIGAGIAVLLMVIVASRRSPEPKILWSYGPVFVGFCPPGIGHDGTVVCSDGFGRLQAFSRSGALLWQTNITQGPVGAAARAIYSVAIASDGTIVCTTGGKLVTLSTNGAIRWEVPANAHFGAPPALAADGTIYVPSRTNNTLQAFSKDGERLWEYAAGGPLINPVVVGHGGDIYFSCLNSNFYALRPDGTLRWRSSVGVSWGSPAIDSDGTIYVPHLGLTLLAPDGRTKSLFTNANVGGFPALDGRGRAYFETMDSYLGFDLKSREVLWRRDRNPVVSHLSIATDQTLYAADFGALIAIDAKTGKTRWEFRRHGRSVLLRGLEWIEDGLQSFRGGRRGRRGGPCNHALSPDGVLYALMPDHKLYALQVGGGLATNAPWPMFQQNPQHTGAAR